MRLLSWNVNGIRSCLQKGFGEFFNTCGADIFCVQETKAEAAQVNLDFPGYLQFWNSAEKKGYSGAMTLTRVPPISEGYAMGVSEHDGEGRLITLEFDGFYLVNVYVPNSQRGLTRLDYRMRWQDDFTDYIRSLDAAKPVVICGDLNVAHTEMDIKNAKSNRRNAGFTDEEREKMTALLKAGLRDTFRELNPDKSDAYTWWSYMANARERNVGWRIDYFLVSERLMGKVTRAMIYPEVMGSDHCPVGLELDI